MPSGVMRLNLPSMSEGDLRSIAKKLIGGALNDREQMAKLHRAIYDELYFQFQQKSEEKKIDKKLIDVWSQKNPIKQNWLSVNKSERCVSENAPRSTEKEEDPSPRDRSVPKLAAKTGNVKNRTKKSVTMKLSETSWNEARQKNEEAFNIWKREKTKTLRRLCKEERMKKQQQLATQQIEYEKRRAAHEAYKRWKLMQTPQRRAKKLQKKVVKDDCLMMLEETNEKIVANEAAFTFSRKQRNDQSREQLQQQIRMLNHDSTFKFGAWLDRLDLVLHEKYMRERRYLVRSFYCQPAYYGSAALCS